MKKILILGLSCLAFSAFAKKGANFEENKKTALEHLDKKISVLQTARNCMASASDRSGVKSCRKAMHESMKGLKSHRKHMKAERMEKRAKRLRGE